jgi:hypothetical protein
VTGAGFLRSTDALSGHRGDLDPGQLRQLDDALRLALGLDDP